MVPSDSYTGVRALLADGQRKGRWTAALVDIVDADTVLAAAHDADLVWLAPGLAVTSDLALAVQLRERRMLAGATPGRLETFQAPSYGEPHRGDGGNLVRIEEVRIPIP